MKDLQKLFFQKVQRKELVIRKMNYTEPKMEITMFSAENIVTESSTLNTLAGDNSYTGTVSYNELKGGSIERALEFN